MSNVKKKVKIYEAILGFLIFIGIIVTLTVVFTPQIERASINLEKRNEEQAAKLAAAAEEEARLKPERTARTMAFKAFGEASKQNDSGIIGISLLLSSWFLNCLSPPTTSATSQ